MCPEVYLKGDSKLTSTKNLIDLFSYVLFSHFRLSDIILENCFLNCRPIHMHACMFEKVNFLEDIMLSELGF